MPQCPLDSALTALGCLSVQTAAASLSSTDRSLAMLEKATKVGTETNQKLQEQTGELADTAWRYRYEHIFCRANEADPE